jgi:hypothetical protein
MVSTTDKVVHKTTKIPEPSLKPLPKRAYDRTTEENEAIVRAEVKAFLAPKVPEPKPTYTQKQKDWAYAMLTAEPQYKMNLPSDYKREIERQSDLAKAKRSGKQIPQLGEQKNQSVAPLIVGPLDIDTSFRADLEEDRLLLDPRVVAAAQLLGLTVREAKQNAALLNVPLLLMLGLEEAPLGEVVEQYVLGGPLIKPEDERGLSTHMRNLLGWYKVHIQKKDFKRWILLDVREEHYFKRYMVHIPMDELFHIFNQRDLDKSTISCYCL